MIVQLEKVAKEYHRGKRKFKVFDDYNLSVNEQELLVISGRSGCGKSTLLALIGGYLSADYGKVSFANKEISKLTDQELSSLHANKIGYLPQSNVMIPEFTILENVMLPSLLLQKKDVREKTIDILKMFEIDSLADKFPCELSGGELRRVALARLFVSEPQLYLFDEPSSGLDKDTTKLVMEYIKECISKGATAIVATHDDIVKDYADRIVELESRGRG